MTSASAPPDEPRRQADLARVRSLFREVNLRIEALNRAFETLLPVGDWVCECIDDACVLRIGLTGPEFAAVRDEPGQFVVAPGHEHPERERVVARYERYTVVVAATPAAAGSRPAAPHD